MSEQNPAPTAPLYTELPFPGHGVVRRTSSKVLLTGLRKHAPELLEREDLRIADIGCGTGEKTAGIAKTFPDADVVGVDINPPSLKKARELATRRGLRASFARCDISDDLLGGLQREGVVSDRLFDVVVSDGVLHHLDEPTRGFAEVRRIIRPDGLFLCYLYSSYGRQDEIAAKALLNQAFSPESSFQDRADAMKLLKLRHRHSLTGNLHRLRWRLRYGPPVRPLEIAKVYFKRDPTVSVSDIVSNPCEHPYTFEQMRHVFESQGWSFVALAKHGGLPTTPEEHTKNPRALALLRSIPVDALFDYFAFYYRGGGFYFFLRPS